jgi:hypothetical protein
MAGSRPDAETRTKPRTNQRFILTPYFFGFIPVPGLLPGELVSAVIQLLTGIFHATVRIVFLTFEHVLDASFSGFMECRYLLQGQ